MAFFIFRDLATPILKHNAFWIIYKHLFQIELLRVVLNLFSVQTPRMYLSVVLNGHCDPQNRIIHNLTTRKFHFFYYYCLSSKRFVSEHILSYEQVQMLFPYTSCLGGNELVPKLTKNTASVYLTFLDPKFLSADHLRMATNYLSRRIVIFSSRIIFFMYLFY